MLNGDLTEPGSAESELIGTLRLAGPIVLAELGWMLMGNVDIMMVGRVGTGPIAAVSLGTTLFYGVAVCAGGILWGMDTLVARAFGADNLDDARHSLIQGIWVTFFLIPLVMGIIWSLDPFLTKFGVNPTVLSGARPYLRALNWSTPALVLYFCFRRYLQAKHLVRPVMWTLVTANLVNLAGNWVLVFGHLGAPELGAVGSAWATCISRTYMAVVLGVVLWRRDGASLRRTISSRASSPGGLSPRGLSPTLRPDFGRIRELLRVGLPAAGQMAVEIGVFGVVTVLVGRLNAAALAGHQIALSTASTTFMVPLGISSAAAVRVGHRLGRGDARGAARSGWMALALGAIVMSGAAVVLLLAPRWIARLFTPQGEVIAAAATLLRIAAFFQLFDGLQIVAIGALRGAGETRVPMLLHFAGYWMIGLPLGAWLCFREGWGAAGLWSGLSLALILIGIALTLAWRRTAARLAMADSRMVR
jgi:multidrug resistance protein, MATE family